MSASSIGTMLFWTRPNDVQEGTDILCCWPSSIDRDGHSHLLFERVESILTKQKFDQQISAYGFLSEIVLAGRSLLSCEQQGGHRFRIPTALFGRNLNSNVSARLVASPVCVCVTWTRLRTCWSHFGLTWTSNDQTCGRPSPWRRTTRRLLAKKTFTFTLPMPANSPLKPCHEAGFTS
ncbi:hypothetical protein VTN31DRAFT_5774 [Thermomyces dupontii]|uniref:uncharacterized protein n=1 Tax=Talaromyces thermophilus TaxID=28565 RepID=UPI0037421339